MADYDNAYNTSLGDFLSHAASEEGLTRGEMEKRTEIYPIHVSIATFAPRAREKAVEEFNRLAAEYDDVVELTENLDKVGMLGMFFESYTIRGTGLRYLDFDEQQE